MANFTIWYTDMDGFQFVYFQDTLERSMAIGKLPLVTDQPVNFTIGPNRECFVCFRLTN